MADLTRQNMFRYGAEISKAYQDENGDWIVEGIASNGVSDHEGDSIEPDGLDYKSYFLKKGFVKWEHGKNPENFIGEPLSAEIRKEGFFIRARLYPHAELAQKAVQAIEALVKSNASRKIGFSIEGNVVKRDPKNPARILKAIVRNVALTANPVNDTTWAALAKSLTSEEAFDFELDESVDMDIDKAMDTAAGEPLMPESLEKDAKTKIRMSLLELVKHFLKKKKKIDKPEGETEVFAKAVETCNLTEPEAEWFAEYVIEKSLEIRELVNETVAGGVKKMEDLTKALDDSLEELKKSIQGDEAFEEEDTEEVEKAIEEDVEEVEDSEDEVEKSIDDEEDEEVDEEVDEEDEEVEKSFRDALEDDEEFEKALEVSELLETLVDALTGSLNGVNNTLSKSLNSQEGVNKALLQSLESSNSVIKSLTEKIDAQADMMKSMQTTMDEILSQPVGRKAVVNGRELHTVNKGTGMNKSMDSKPLTKGQIVDVLVKAVEKGDLEPMAVTKFEVTGELPAHVKESLGL